MSPEPDTNNAFQTPPCVGRCSTVYGDAVCRGCKRFSHEVIHWNQYTNAQKEQVWRRIGSLVCQVLPRWVTIERLNTLSRYLDENGLRYPKHLSPYSWALVCLEYFPKHLQALPSATGLRANHRMASKHNQNKTSFMLGLQNELYQISCAYHQRQTQCIDIESV